MGPSFAASTTNPPASMTLGNNLDGVVDWDTDWPFVDVFNRTRTWMTRNLDGSGAWDSGYGSLVTLDSNGWPTTVPFQVNGTNQLVHTIITALNGPGTYEFIYQGTGSLVFGWYPGSTVNLTATGGVQSYKFTAVSNTEAWVEIHGSASNDYLRNFHIVLTNYLASYQTQPFDPVFLQRLQPFGCFRFMDWAGINGSSLSSWSNRPTPTYYTQTTPNGVALEYMVQLCNLTQKNMWLCIPHLADDNYVQQVAQYVHDHLAPFLRVYIEYSNETWNSGFVQTAYVQSEGVALNLDPSAYTAGQKYAAMRSAQIWIIFNQVFGSDASNRLVKVLATQSSWTGVTTMRLAGLQSTNINPTGIMPDVLAIAPYFGTQYTPSQIPPNAPYPTVDDILTNQAVAAISNQLSQVAAQRAIATAQGWGLVCYEAGQTYEGVNGAENDTNLTAICTEANRDPRMYGLYTQYLNMLQGQGVSLMNNFSYCSSWSKWGSWGSLEWQDEPTNAAPKYAALVDWIAANPVPVAPVTLSAAWTNNSLRLAYGPVTGGVTYTLVSSGSPAGGWSAPATLANWQTNGSQISVSDTGPDGAQKFYRVQITPP